MPQVTTHPPTSEHRQIASELNVKHQQVDNVVQLLDAGNTVPFITRYRKEQTGNLDEEQIREVRRRVLACRQLADRARTILRLIESRGQLTDRLRAQILDADSIKRLEDLYLPYRAKRRSRATTARERGLQPLADMVWAAAEAIQTLESACRRFVDPARELPDTASVLQGVSDLLAERIAEDVSVREFVRKLARDSGQICVTRMAADHQDAHAFRDYEGFRQSATRLPAHRCLALNRGEKSGVLRVRIKCDETGIRDRLRQRPPFAGHRFRDLVQAAADDALMRLILPSLEREMRRELTHRAERQAIGVFTRNLNNLLLQPPLPPRRVLAIDPGFRTGCKIAVLDEHGKCLATDQVYVTGAAAKKSANCARLAEMMTQFDCQMMAIGNGTGCRETEELISLMNAERDGDWPYVIVNESGASIYSTSPVAREEFPSLDAIDRGTVSIGRRLQDPLSELVKIDPQHLGVGMYQHDLDPKQLRESLDQVVESCVNAVGVDLNTASTSLLQHVSGFNQRIARQVAEWRDTHGPFRARSQLLSVPGVGKSTYTQAAGFLKIHLGDEPLDGTWIHPESYPVANRLLERMSSSATDLLRAAPGDAFYDQLQRLDSAQLAAEFDLSLPTVEEMIATFERPCRDPRSDLSGPVFRRGVLKLEDLGVGMELTGTVLNVVDFGAFIDVGLKDSGLVHISQMSTGFVSDPHEIVAVGDVVTVWVLRVEHDRRRVSLGMVDPSEHHTTGATADVPRNLAAGPDARPSARGDG